MCMMFHRYMWCELEEGFPFQTINYNGNNVSPPDQRGRSPSAGVNGRTDWKAKYLK